MLRTLFVIVALMFAIPAPSQAYDSMLTCTLYHSASTDDPGDITTRTLREPLVLMFSDLDGDVPLLKGNALDNVPLTRLDESGDGVLYLAESTPFGNLFYYTLYREQNILTFSKDYILEGKPLSIKMVGACR